MNDQTNRINHPQLTGNNAVIPVCTAYSTAGAAINGLADVGIDLRHLNVLGKGHQTHEKRGMSYNTDDCTKSVGGVARRERCLLSLRN